MAACFGSGEDYGIDSKGGQQPSESRREEWLSASVWGVDDVEKMAVADGPRFPRGETRIRDQMP